MPEKSVKEIMLINAGIEILPDDTECKTVQLTPRQANEASMAIKPHIPHIAQQIDALVSQAVDVGEDVILVNDNHIAAYDVYVKYAD